IPSIVESLFPFRRYTPLAAQLDRVEILLFNRHQRTRHHRGDNFEGGAHIRSVIIVPPLFRVWPRIIGSYCVGSARGFGHFIRHPRLRRFALAQDSVDGVSHPVVHCCVPGRHAVADTFRLCTMPVAHQLRRIFAHCITPMISRSISSTLLRRCYPANLGSNQVLDDNAAIPSTPPIILPSATIIDDAHPLPNTKASASSRGHGVHRITEQPSLRRFCSHKSPCSTRYST